MSLIWVLVARDLSARLRDRSVLILGLLAPAALMTVFSFLVAGPDSEHLPVAYAAEADAPVAAVLERGSLASLAAEGTIELRRYDDAAAVLSAVEDERVDAGIAVRADGAVEVVLGGESPVADAIVEAVARSAAVTTTGIGRAVAAEQALGRQPDPVAVGAALMSRPATESVRTAEGVGGIDPKTQAAAGMATFFLFFTVQFGVLGLLEERQQGTLPRLLAAPVRPWQLLVAKVTVSYLAGLLSMGCLIAFSVLLLDTSWGDPLGLAALVAAGVLAAVSTVTLVVGVARSVEQAAAAQAAVALVLGILGGSFFSMSRSGGAAAILTRLTPHYWFGEGLVQLTGGRGLDAIVVPVAALLGFAVLLGVPGLLLAGRSVRP